MSTFNLYKDGLLYRRGITENSVSVSGLDQGVSSVWNVTKVDDAGRESAFSQDLEVLQAGEPPKQVNDLSVPASMFPAELTIASNLSGPCFETPPVYLYDINNSRYRVFDGIWYGYQGIDDNWVPMMTRSSAEHHDGSYSLQLDSTAGVEYPANVRLATWVGVRLPLVAGKYLTFWYKSMDFDLVTWYYPIPGSFVSGQMALQHNATWNKASILLTANPTDDPYWGTGLVLNFYNNDPAGGVNGYLDEFRVTDTP